MGNRLREDWNEVLAIAALSLAAAVPALAQQGVTAERNRARHRAGPVGSDRVAVKPAVNGMRMKIDEVNAAGGVNGRKMRLVVEDHGYDPKKAVLAAQKMVQQDKIFAAIGSIGTPTAMAAMPIYLDEQGGAPLPAHRRARRCSSRCMT